MRKEQGNENRNIIRENNQCREQDQQETAYIAKKQALIAKKQQLIEAKGLVKSDSSEALTLKWDIEHYTDDISRLEREIAETTLHPY